MELYDEQQVMEEKKSKLPVIIGSCIVILVIITILIVCGIIYLKSSITTIQIDGQKNYEIEEILHIEETSAGLKLYIPIIKMADFLGYEGFTGDYSNKSEDKTKCHIISDNEIAMFTLDSDVLIKMMPNSEMEYIKLDKPVFEKNGQLYTTIDGMQKGFNVLLSSDKSLKNINIYTMEYLIKYYATSLKIKEYSTSFTDQKAIFENMIIIQDDNRYGVINATNGKTVLETKYEGISYVPETTDFLVKSNGKYGIVTKDATMKVRAVYDSIKTMDNINGLYLVQQNDNYGVINREGNTIIESEYKQMGMNIDKYTQNGIQSSFVLLNELIPVKNDQDLWALFNVKGEKITEFKYTGIGCSDSTVSNSYPALVIPNYNIIIVQKGDYYNLVTLEGRELAPENRLNAVFLRLNTTTEENQYFMVFDNNQKIVNIEEWLAGAEQ